MHICKWLPSSLPQTFSFSEYFPDFFLLFSAIWQKRTTVSCWGNEKLGSEFLHPLFWLHENRVLIEFNWIGIKTQGHLSKISIAGKIVAKHRWCSYQNSRELSSLGLSTCDCSWEFKQSFFFYSSEIILIYKSLKQKLRWFLLLPFDYQTFQCLQQEELGLSHK